MTAAWRLCQDPKCTKVTLYEKSPRLGGWLQSEKVEVEGGHVVFEYGPRTVRASTDTSIPIVDLVRNNIYFFFSSSISLPLLLVVLLADMHFSSSSA